MQEVALTRFEGFADIYDKFRPDPPVEIADIAIQALGNPEIDAVVDLGSGTGLSTKIWIGRAKKIIGIEPNEDMRNVALLKNGDSSIEYRRGTSYSTQLPDNSVDIVSCSQSFHWMEPKATLDEVNRVLRSSGVFVAFDNDWPPFVNFQCDTAYHNLFREVQKLLRAHEGSLPKEIQYPKERHLENIRNSGYFRYAKEVYVTSKRICDQERFTNLALSQGGLQALLKNGIEEIQSHIEVFKKEVQCCFRSMGEAPMWINYRIRMAMKG